MTCQDLIKPGLRRINICDDRSHTKSSDDVKQHGHKARQIQSLRNPAQYPCRNRCQDCPSNKGQAHTKILSLVSTHHHLTFIHALTNALVRIISQDKERLAVSNSCNDSRNDEQQRPQYDKQSLEQEQPQRLAVSFKSQEYISDPNDLSAEHCQEKQREPQIHSTRHQQRIDPAQR